MITYNLTEARNKLAEIFPGVATITDDQVRTFAEAFGLALEEPKTAPGTWHKTRNGGWPVFVDEDSAICIFESDGEISYKFLGEPWPALEPALVITEAEYNRLCDKIKALAELRDDAEMMAKNSSPTPSPETIWNVLNESWSNWVEVGINKSLDYHTDAIMSLLQKDNQ